MSGDDFQNWMAHRGYNIGQAAAALGLGRNTVARYLKKGTTDKTVALACSADAAGLQPWPVRV